MCSALCWLRYLPPSLRPLKQTALEGSRNMGRCLGCRRLQTFGLNRPMKQSSQALAIFPTPMLTSFSKVSDLFTFPFLYPSLRYQAHRVLSTASSTYRSNLFRVSGEVRTIKKCDCPTRVPNTLIMAANQEVGRICFWFSPVAFSFSPKGRYRAAPSLTSHFRALSTKHAKYRHRTQMMESDAVTALVCERLWYRVYAPNLDVSDGVVLAMDFLYNAEPCLAARPSSSRVTENLQPSHHPHRCPVISALIPSLC